MIPPCCRAQTTSVATDNDHVIHQEMCGVYGVENEAKLQNGIPNVLGCGLMCHTGYLGMSDHSRNGLVYLGKHRVSTIGAILGFTEAFVNVPVLCCWSQNSNSATTGLHETPSTG